MTFVASLLDLVYVLIPLVVIGVGAWRARRDRSAKPLRPVLTTLVSALVIGFALNFAYAQAAAARWRVSEVLLTGWFLAGVLLVLKGFGVALQRGATWLATRLPTRVGERGRRATALGVRCVMLFTLGMPYVMAIGMVYRCKVAGADPMEQLGFPFEDVTFGATSSGVLPSRNDVALAGWWIPARPLHVGEAAPAGWGTRTVLLCHGLGSSKANAVGVAEHLVRAGYNVLAFDFRAHGGSGGHVTAFGDAERRDVLAAVAWLRRERPAQARRIFGVGASMGAAALVAAAADPSPEGRAIDAVAVYGTYDDLGALARTVCDRQFPRPLNWLGRHMAVPLAGLHAGRPLADFAPGDVAERLSPRPLLVIHGTDDEIIAFEHGRRLFERAGEPRSHLWIPGDHNSVLNDAGAARAVREFFDAAVPHD
jgi:alpha-beta hydrolase superfamily lysophospholipase